MGTISTGVGLMSGLDIQSIVDQLMALEARPLQLTQSRIAETKQQQAAYLALNASLSAVKGAINALVRPTAFRARTVTSSNENVLTATVSSTAAVGTTSLQVRSLVASHQLVSGGFASRQSTLGGGLLTFESARADVAPATGLNVLNGGAGVGRGMIRITDRAGGSADIDLTAATTIDDVLQAINGQATARVRASVQGDALRIEDLTGSTTYDLRIVDLGEGRAAADLGIAGSSATGSILGHDLVHLANTTRLRQLNDGNGLRFNASSADLRVTLADGTSFDVNLTAQPTFDTPLALLNDGAGVRAGTIRITNHDGQQADIDLSEAQTIHDVKNAIAAADIGVTISAISGSRLVVNDATTGTASNLIIEDVTGHAAADLGIAVDTESNTVNGSVVYRIETLGTVLRAIEHAAGNDGSLSVAIDGNGLVLTDQTGGGGTATVEALNDSKAARDLGIEGAFDGAGQLEGRDLIAGLNTVLLATLNGGEGLATGTLDFTLRDGTVLNSLDFTGAQTLSDVLDVLNATGLLRAEVDAGRTRIRITDLTSGAGELTATGDMADALGLSAGGMGELISDDLQKQYVTKATLLSDLRPGAAFSYGRLQITNAAGVRQTLTLSANLHKSTGDVIDAINALNMDVTARLNAAGDGIELLDTSGGDGTLAVIDLDGGKAAAELGIAGEADETGLLAGTLARRVEIGAADTLEDAVAKINGSGANVTASIINDGSGDTPYRLVLTSRTAGTQGRVLFATDVPSLSLSTLSQATDAKVVLGQAGSPNAVVVTSDSNTLEDLVPGLTLTLHGTSTQPVEVTVDRDVEASVTDVKTFIKTFNDAMDKMNELTRFEPETNKKGILLGDSTVRQIQTRLFRIINGVVGGDAMTYSRLGELGVMVDSTGGSPRLTLSRTLSNGTVIDGESKLRAALAEDPEAVSDFFTRLEAGEGDDASEPVGFAARMNDALDQITTTAGGLLATQNQRLADRVDQFERRADQLQTLLNYKEARLYAQFQAMERALADLQAQQSALVSLSNLASSFNYTGNQK